MCDTPVEKSWQLSKWLLKQSVINIHSSLQNNFLVRHWPVALVGREGRKKSLCWRILFSLLTLLFCSFSVFLPWCQDLFTIHLIIQTLVFMSDISHWTFAHLFPLIPPPHSPPLVRKWAFITVRQSWTNIHENKFTTVECQKWLSLLLFVTNKSNNVDHSIKLESKNYQETVLQISITPYFSVTAFALLALGELMLILANISKSKLN